MTKPKRFLDSLRQMVSPPEDKTCSICNISYSSEACPSCGKPADNGSSSAPQNGNGEKVAYLVDLVSNHKIQIPIPLCKVGRDESNDIVISGDQAISRQHLLIVKENEQFYIEDVKSRHGTFINGNQLQTKELINDGDVIKIGVSLFWFVTETSGVGDDSSSAQSSSGSHHNVPKADGNTALEPQHVSVKSEFFLEPTDPSTSTATDIPVMTNDEVLLDRLKLKARSFEHADALIQSQIQPGTFRTPTGTDSGTPASSTQQLLPALDGVLAGISDNRLKPIPVSPNTGPGIKAAAVMVKEAIDDPMDAVDNVADSAVKSRTAPQHRSLNDHLSKLDHEHKQLQAQIEEAEKRRQEIADNIASIREMINNLLGGSGNVLLGSCKKVLSQLGWECNATGEDGQELQLKINDQNTIVHIISTATMPDRSELGKLFIAQTRLWCEQGLEPKGIFIISWRTDENNPEKNIQAINPEIKTELANFIKNKNVCLLTAVNLLAIYHDMTISHADANLVREKIINTDGWLEGFEMPPPDNDN